MQLGEFDCGCDNRKEIMGAENWQRDIAVIVAVAVFTAVALYVMKATT